MAVFFIASIVFAQIDIKNINKTGFPNNMSNSRDSTIYRLEYNCEASNYFRNPYQYVAEGHYVDYYNMKFMVFSPKTLMALGIILYEPECSGTPDLDIYVWGSINGYPDTTNIIFSTTILNADLVYYPDYVHVELPAGVEVPSDFHIAWTTNGEGDTLAGLIDDGTCGPNRASMLVDDNWTTPMELWEDDFNFLIYADIVFGNDGDNDGFVNDSDNCMFAYNPLQEDSDNDGVGDSCDNCIENSNPNQTDNDFDNIGNFCDNCTNATNPLQEDIDIDGLGDSCDLCTDTDGDGYGDPGYLLNTCDDDNCPSIYNPDQEDADGDSVGDSCDICPGYDDHADYDGDGFPDSCDVCPDIYDPDQFDTDSDLFGDSCDNCLMNYNPGQEDYDSDEIGDSCDTCTDSDGDGYGDPGFPANTCTFDNCPNIYNTNQIDSDGDGFGDSCDICPGYNDSLDSDGDGMPDGCDICPGFDDYADNDSDSIPDSCDNCPEIINTDQLDYDSDGVGDTCDNCPFVSNPNQNDFDADGMGDECDDCVDTDGDGYGNPGYPDNNCPTDSCPYTYNSYPSSEICRTPVSLRATVSPVMLSDTILLNTDFYINIHMNNNSGNEIAGYSMPLAFYSPDGSITEITHRDVGEYGPYGSIVLQNGFDTLWDLANTLLDFSWDGSLPDTINHTCASLNGWPSSLGEQIYIRFALRIDQEGMFCIDSISHSNGNYDWLFPEPPVNFNGPYCWWVEYVVDTDSDGIPDESDNCPDIYNPNQSNLDGDSLGDLCDDDIDNDGYLNDNDNCPYTYNPGQEDSDEDGIGDVCDKDSIYIIIENGQDSTGIRDSSFIIEILLKTADTVTGGNLGFTWADGNTCWQLDTVIFGPELNQWNVRDYTPPGGPNGSDLNSWVAIGGAAFPENPYMLPDTTYLWAELHFEHQNPSPQWALGSQMILDSSFVPPANTVTLAHSNGTEITPCIGNPTILFPADIDTDLVVDIYDNCPDIYNPLQEDTNGNGIGDVCEGCCEMAGDASHSGVLNIFDITYIISYLYLDGPPPQCYDEAEVNADNLVNIFDITYLIAYLYQDGPAPTCGTTGL